MKKMPLLIHHHHAHDVLAGACTNHSADELLLKNTAVPLLVQNETGVSHSYDKKNEANAKLNTAHAHHYNLIHHNKDRDTINSCLHKPINISTTTTTSNNVYRNVNLSLTPTPHQSVQPPPSITTDKLYDKQALSAVINWGAPSPSSSPV